MKIAKAIGAVLILIGLLANPFVLNNFFTEGVFSVKIIIFVVVSGFILIFLGVIAYKTPEKFSITYIWQNRKKEMALLIATIIFCIILLEIVLRLLYAGANGLPLFYSNEELIYPALYSEMKDYSSNSLNVLLLGGSTLNFVAVSGVLENISLGTMKFYNMAYPAHTSLDSAYKYKYLVSKGYKFDYAVFYHGINEARANNVPEELFSDNYEHYSFYRLSNSVFEKKGWLRHIAKSALAHKAYEVFINLYSNSIFNKRLVPQHAPKKEWTEFGSKIKSAASFRKNFIKIIELANKEDAKLISLKFAFNYPEGYSLQGYLNGSLGYSNETDGQPLEVWGKPENVVKGMVVHNNILKELEGRHIHISTDTISSDITNFYDICHFSGKGRGAFARLLIGRISEERYSEIIDYSLLVDNKVENVK